ncbi:Prohead protease [uncultured Caudovirales phage]|uniref:Prohead protease n=1 Tax=uncultured Caudovirales phage TaxID=2100421 RepID=A0A6J5RT92_9CAUD|nr:Prohead protease [uncultured Caudovirales phage]CAB5238338.1 Prohead protease [uncultured Caudovirales phage]
MKTLKIPNQLFREGMSQVDNGTLRLSICSDLPYLRYNWADGEEYYEVLDHSEGSIDLSRLSNGAALLFNHKRDIQIGLIDSPSIENGRCYVNAKLSNAPDVASYKTRVEEGILKDTSIGYEVTDEGTQIGEIDGIPAYKFKFAIHEASLVTIPADPTVGLGRSRSEEPKCGLKEISIGSKKNIDLTQVNCNKPSMTKENEVAETPVETPTPAETPAPAVVETPAETPVETPAAEPSAKEVKAAAISGERTRVAELRKWAKDISALRNIDLTEPLFCHIEEGKSLPEFKEWVLENEFKSKPVAFSSETSGANVLSRSAFTALSPSEQAAHCMNGGKIKD